MVATRTPGVLQGLYRASAAPNPGCFTFFLTVKQFSLQLQRMSELSDYDRGVFIGLLVGEGSFGGDGKQPQVALRMHTRHEALFEWLMQRFPRTKLYGPYTHGGRSYYQWMARGRTLVEDVLPVLESHIRHDLDGHAAERFEAMVVRYAGFIGRERERIRAAATVRAAESAVGEPGNGDVRDPEDGGAQVGSAGC